VTAAMTGNAQVAIYAADALGAAPGTLLYTSAVVTNPGIGVATFTFSGSPWVAQGRFYYVVLLTDATITVNTASGASKWSVARTYASGFPNPAPAVAGPTTSPPFFTLNLTGNAVTVSEAIANGDTDFVFDATVGDSDLYDMDDLPVLPAAIIGVVSKLCKKSDAGARQGQVLLKSGATQVTGPDTVLSSTYTYLYRVDAVDPNTGTTWTLANLNAVQVGQKVTA
jgi:hypothetical protein